jgi:OOP family OmpA-OmpF porin
LFKRACSCANYWFNAPQESVCLFARAGDTRWLILNNTSATDLDKLGRKTMFDLAGKNKIAATLAPAAVLVCLSTGAAQADDGRFVTSPSGEGVTTGYGECWNATGGTEGVQPCVPAAQAAEGDADGDGVPDSRDRCPNTPRGAVVDADGCPRDSDGDGVPDYRDQCPNTPRGAKVDANGCEIMADVTINVTADHFDFDSAELKPKMQSALDEVAAKVKATNGDETLDIIGHTDSTGPDAYNQGLSERRAQAAADYLAGAGVNPARMTVKGMGESSPVADNSTREGRAMNRRVEIMTR